MTAACSRRVMLFSVLLCLAMVGRAADAHLGLRNQGNTCYMNSLLQSLHHLPEFRKGVYAIPARANGSSTAGADLIPLELQRLFYRLENGDSAGLSEVGTEQLTRSFGWGRAEVMVQQDVQEFSRMLCDALQQSMRAHGVRDEVAALFEGRTSSVTRCTRVDFSSEKEERFYDLQMQVQGCRSLHASFRQFVREERLTGDNKYNTRDPQLGRQEARRGTRFKTLPPVLQLHLKRFEYDLTTGSMHKLQQAFTFPTLLQLNQFMARGVPNDGPAPEYELHAVLSHIGEAGEGHYVAYVRPRGSKQWLEFDDTRVSKVGEDVAVRQQYGGRHARSRGGYLAALGPKPNAYMLVYVRRDLARTEDEQPAAVLDPEVRAAFERELRRPARSRAAGRTSILDFDDSESQLAF